MDKRYDPARVFWITLLVAGAPAWIFAGVTFTKLSGANYWARNSPHFFVYAPIFMPLAAALLAAVLIGGAPVGPLRRRGRPAKAWLVTLFRWAWAPARGWGVLVGGLSLVVALTLVFERKHEGATRDVWEFNASNDAIAVDACLRPALLAEEVTVPPACSTSAVTAIVGEAIAPRFNTCVVQGESEAPPGLDKHRRCLVEAWDDWARDAGSTSPAQIAVDVVGVLVLIVLFGTAAQWLVVRQTDPPAAVDIALLRLAYAYAMLWFPLRLYSLWYRNFYSLEAVSRYDVFTAAAVLGVATGLLLIIVGTGRVERTYVDWAGLGGALAAVATLIAQVFRPSQVIELFGEIAVYLQIASQSGAIGIATVIVLFSLTCAWGLVRTKSFLVRNPLAVVVESSQSTASQSK